MVTQLIGGLRSGMAIRAGHDQDSGEHSVHPHYLRLRESHVHDVIITKEARISVGVARFSSTPAPAARSSFATSGGIAVRCRGAQLNSAV